MKFQHYFNARREGKTMKNKKISALAPCSCGGTPRPSKVDDVNTMKCTICGYAVSDSTLTKATKKWNDRFTQGKPKTKTD